jgi:hypothetical protein
MLTMAYPYVYPESVNVKRLPRGTRVAPTRAGWEIETATKERVDKLARRAGVSSSVFIERVIDHLDDELTVQGIPSWWPEQEPAEDELPIDAA